MKRNLFLLKLDYFLGGFWLLAPLVVVYFQTITDSYTLAMLVFSLASITTLLCEIPSGILSDFLGRKKNTFNLFIVDVFLFYLLGNCWRNKEYLSLIFRGIFFGASDAFLSGTDEALMYETMDCLNDSKNFDSFFAKACIWNQFGSASSAVIGAILVYFFSLQFLVWASVLPAFFSLLIIFLLKEPERALLKPRVSVIRHFKDALICLHKNKTLFFSQ